MVGSYPVGVCGSGPVLPDDPPAVVIVSDVLLYREGLAASLGRDGRLNVVATTRREDALAALSQQRLDAMLIDGAATDCRSLAHRVRTVAPEVKIVGFGISGGTARIIDCAESGLTAFVDSDGSVDELVAATLAALRGELACSPRVSALMCERLAQLSLGPAGTTSLTRREHEVAVLIGQGLSNKEIANYLRIGASTVKNHVHSILEKLQVRRRSAIVGRVSQPVWMIEGR